jgi:hypothetical protein
VALQGKTRFRGVQRVGWTFTLAAAALQFDADAEPDRGTRMNTYREKRVQRPKRAFRAPRWP